MLISIILLQRNQMKNRVLIVTPRLNLVGGVSSYWNAILPDLRMDKNLKIHNIEIGGNKRNMIGPVVDQLRFRKILNLNFSLVFLNPSLSFRSFFRDAFFIKQLVKKNIPFIVFFHGWDLDFEKKVDKKYIIFFLNTFGKAKRIFVLSKDFKEKIIEWGYQGEIAIETTNVDTVLLKDFSIDKKLTYLKKTNTIKILFLARLIREKGVFETVDAFREIQKKYFNIQLVIAGDGNDLDELKSYVKGDNNIIVTGRVEGQKKIKIFKDCSIYCFPTFYGEGLPISILEAMAFGMAVITTNMGGLNEFFQNNKMGYLVRPKNVDELYEKIEILLLDKIKLVKIGKYNHDYAKKNLISSVIAKRIDNQIIDVINEL